MEDKKRGIYAGIEVTSKCNMGCLWCYDNSKFQGSKDMSTSQLVQAIDNLDKIGVGAINLTGREATVRNDLEELLGHAKGLGMTTILTTNGLNLLEKHQGALKYTDWLSLPLDAPNAEICNTIRCTNAGQPSDHYRKFFGIMNYIADKPIRLKVNTVVEKRNFQMVPEIGSLLNCDIWKIARVKREGRAKEFWPVIGINDEEYSQTMSKINENYNTGRYANVGDINTSCPSFGNGTYPLPLINSIGDLYFPSEENLDTGLNVLDMNFVEKMNKFLDRNGDVIKNNKVLFKSHYGVRNG